MNTKKTRDILAVKYKAVQASVGLKNMPLDLYATFFICSYARKAQWWLAATTQI